MLGEHGLETKRGTEQEQRVARRSAGDGNKKNSEGKNRLKREASQREIETKTRYEKSRERECEGERERERDRQTDRQTDFRQT